MCYAYYTDHFSTCSARPSPAKTRKALQFLTRRAHLKGAEDARHRVDGAHEVEFDNQAAS